MNRILTVGHGQLAEAAFTELVRRAEIGMVVDIRSLPGSRRHPYFAREQMERWLPDSGIGYRWERRLGGFRKSRPNSPNTALRNPSFRGYADYMESPEFAAGVGELLGQGPAGGETSVMCSESLWWRCHRRLLSDYLVLVRGLEVVHLMHDGRLSPHHPTEGVRPKRGGLVYDVGTQPELAGPGGQTTAP